MIYKEIGMDEVVNCLKNTTKLTAQIFILIAARSVFSQVLAIAQVPIILIEALSGLSPHVFLLILNLILLVNLAIGMVTPSFGLNLFVILSIFDRPLEKIARTIVPFFVYLWLPELSMAY